MRLALLFLISSAPALGWWCEGHEVVALIAQKHLDPNALAAVNRLLSSEPVDPSLHRGCQDRPNNLMADASTWADDVKKSELTGPWHYMDLPLGMKSGDIEAYCEPVGPSPNGKDRPGCILSALRYNLNILHDPKETDSEKAKALRYMIHLLGDLHMPLHTTANNDQGGNCVPIQFFTDTPPVNLHSVWDGKIFARDLASSGKTLEQMAADLDARYSKDARAWTRHGTEFARWVWEGHKIAQGVVYANLQPRIPTEPFEKHPDCKAESDKNAELHLMVDQRYQEAAAPVVEEQLAKAGYRLAEVLNEVWP